MSGTRRAVGWTLVIGSLLMHAFTVWTFAKQPDSLAAFTVLPIWVWGGIGLFMSFTAFCVLRAPLSLIVTAVWAVTLSVAVDEARSLSNFNHPVLLPVRTSTPGTFRIATINCAAFSFGNPIPDLKQWDPDIVIMQQTYPHLVKRASETLFGAGGDFRAYRTNGIATRFEILREVRNPSENNQQVTIRLPSGREIEVVNVHLATAATDMRLWSSASRALHRRNRNRRRNELSVVLQILGQTSRFPSTPTLLGGDFNSSSTDVVHRQLTRDFDDVFSAVGRGLGNTFHRRFPIIRIDHIYTTRHFQPLSSKVIVSKHTDHRIVIADISLRD